jgi:hypothetical protein
MKKPQCCPEAAEIAWFVMVGTAKGLDELTCRP